MSEFSLDFSDRVDYSGYDEVTVEIFIANGPGIQIAIDAKVDTGSRFCIFQPQYANLLDISLGAGLRERIRTAAGHFIAYGHEVTLTVSDFEWETVVYFAEVESFPVNVVGRFITRSSSATWRRAKRSRSLTGSRIPFLRRGTRAASIYGFSLRPTSV